MKKIISLSLAVLASITFMHAQSFKGHASGAFGILNLKYRVQYEMPLKDKTSLGINMNYYLLSWKGPVFEPFVRLYDPKNGNTQGLFVQAKLMYGNLSAYKPPYTSEEPLDNKRWSTFGFGASFGHKYLFYKHFTIEPLTGFRYLSAPSSSANADDPLFWILTTGLLLDLQIKLGYQF